jgi:hypothetical protein
MPCHFAVFNLGTGLGKHCLGVDQARDIGLRGKAQRPDN